MKKGEMIKIYTVKDFDLKNKVLIHEGRIEKITKNFVYVEFGDRVQKYIRRSNCKKTKNDYDSVPNREVYKIFVTLSKEVDFSGCKTPEDVNQRIQEEIIQYMSELSSPNTDSSEKRRAE